MDAIEKRARELLAAEYRSNRRNTHAEMIEAGDDPTTHDEFAIRAIISALEPQWQPIESAPSQGCILAFCPDDGQYVATRSGNSWCLDTGDVMLLMDPTHWQPLPAPPQV